MTLCHALNLCFSKIDLHLNALSKTGFFTSKNNVQIFQNLLKDE